MIEKIKEIALLAGETLREGFTKNFEIEFKTNESNLVTEYDKRSEKLIIEFIQKEFPTHGILAEESGEHSRGGEYTWIIDPLDGTTNFAHKLPLFSVSIGVQKNGEMIYGVVNDVMHNQLFYAEKGSGSFKNSQQLSVSKTNTLARALLVTGFPYDIAENPSNALEIFNKLILKSRGIRRLGSAAIDFCYLAEGVFDGYWEVHLHPWDVAAGKLVVEEAGGLVTDFEGTPTDVFSPQFLSSNGLLHNQIKEIIEDARFGLPF